VQICKTVKFYIILANKKYHEALIPICGDSRRELPVHRAQLLKCVPKIRLYQFYYYYIIEFVYMLYLFIY